MILAFTLSMPQRPSASRWGEDRIYCVVQRFSTKRGKEKAEKILAGGPYSYSFRDGWGMGIDVRSVDAKEAASLRKRSAGCAGYNWALDSIYSYGKIMDDQQIKQFLQQQKAGAECQKSEIKNDSEKNLSSESKSGSSERSSV